ncbi:MAG: hypothetical protein V4620_09800 [Bacteroidota bacterium]
MKVVILYILVVLVASCGVNNPLPANLKKGLVGFSVNKSYVTQQLENSKPFDAGALWINFNKINVKTHNDTLTVNVNTYLSKTLNYEGGYEFLHDTLFLYAKNIDNQLKKDTIHSTLTYKILTQGRLYKEIEFKEVLEK